MIKKERGITLISILIIIVVMGIIASTVIYISFDRFEANNLKKMHNDIEVLADKVSNYNLKYGGLPVLRDSSNTPIIYTNSSLNFEKNSADNGTYYILDLKAMGDLALNYGGIGYENPNTSDDVYIINEASHHIYYVRGIELNNKLYHTIMKDDSQITDIIPPSSPEIKVISGIEESKGLYITPIDVEIIPGKDNWSGILETSYSIDSGYYNYLNTEDNIFNISENGSHTIKAITYDDAGNPSKETVLTVTVHIEHVWDNGTVTKAATCTNTGVMTYKCTICDEIRTETIPVLGHAYITTTDSYVRLCPHRHSKVYSCNVCGASGDSVTEGHYSAGLYWTYWDPEMCFTCVCGANPDSSDGYYYPDNYSLAVYYSNGNVELWDGMGDWKFGSGSDNYRQGMSNWWTNNKNGTTTWNRFWQYVCVGDYCGNS